MRLLLLSFFLAKGMMPSCDDDVDLGKDVDAIVSTAVGDFCRPESEPATGFQAADVYLETASVQCQSGTCMVHQLNGPASQSFEECASMRDPSECSAYLSQDVLDEHVYCTCRCAGPEESTLPFCECGDGFECGGPLLTFGDVDVRGSYCVRTPD